MLAAVTADMALCWRMTWATASGVLRLILQFAGVTLAIQRADGSSSFSATCSSAVEGFAADGALDGDRFSAVSGAAWKGRAGRSNWWWQVQFDAPRVVGAILQIQGDHEFVLRSGPAAITPAAFSSVDHTGFGRLSTIPFSTGCRGRSN